MALFTPSPSPPPEGSDATLGRWLLGGSLAVGAALRVALALGDDGIYWPDEVYQSLEPAHRLVFGYGQVAWEFVEGARSWALPGLVAGLLRLCAALGLDHPSQYLAGVRVAFALLGVGAAFGVYRLGRALGASELAAATGSALFSLMGPAIYFAPRAMSENAAALPVVLGLALALHPGARRGERIAGASLLGLAVMLRLHAGVFCAGLVLLHAARRRWRDAAEATATLAGWALAFGLLDRLTWGSWFHSAAAYLQFNLVRDGASAWGVAPFAYYFRHLFTSMPTLALAVLALSALALRRAAGVWGVAAAFLLLHALVPHKELRFVLPVLPVFCALAAVGADALPRKGSRWVACPMALLLALPSAAGHRSLTFGQLGQYPERAAASAYDDFGPVNRMLLAAHDRPDVCGVFVTIAHFAWTGGHSYLHRNVPLYAGGKPPRDRRHFNYVITQERPGLPGEVVTRDARQPNVVLMRVSQQGCAPDHGYSWRLP